MTTPSRHARRIGLLGDPRDLEVTGLRRLASSHTAQVVSGWLLRLLLAVLVMTVAGCQTDPSAPTTESTPTIPPPAAPTSAPSTPSTSASPPAHTAVLAGYARFWEVYVQAAATADPDYPGLAQVATGQALEGLRLQLTVDRRDRIVARGQPVRSATRITQLAAGRAALIECLDSNRWLAHDAATGALRDTPSGLVRRVGALLTHTTEGWKVAKLDITEEPCDG